MVLTMRHSDKLLYNDALANLLTSFINANRVHYADSHGSFGVAAPRASFIGQFIILLLRFECPN